MSNTTSKKKVIPVLLVAVIIMLALLLYINSRTAPQSSFLMEGRSKLAIKGEAAAVSNSSSMVYCVQNLLIEAQEENLRAKSTDGNIAWSQKLPGKIVRLAEAGDSVIIIDSLNNISYCSLQGKLIWTYQAGYEIADVFTEDNGSFLVEYKGMTGSHAEVFNEGGSKIAGISVEKSHILSFSSGTNAFSISVLDTSGESIKSKIITYDLKGDILWAQNFESEIISKLNYSKNQDITAIGENIAYVYKNDGILKDRVEIQGDISHIAMNDDIIAIAIHDKGRKYSVCFGANMKELSRLEIEKDPMGIHTMKNSYIIYYDDELLVLTSKGELTARYKSNTDINSVYMTNDNKVYIVSSRRLQQLEYIK